MPVLDLIRIFSHERSSLRIWSSLFRQLIACSEISIPFNEAIRDWIHANKRNFSATGLASVRSLLHNLDQGSSFIAFLRTRSSNIPKDVRDLLLLAPDESQLPRFFPAARQMIEQKILRVRHIQQAVLYPIQILLILSLIYSVYRWKVLPPLSSYLSALRSDLSFPLKLLDSIAHYSTLLLVIGGLLTGAIIALILMMGRSRLDQFLLRVPIVRNQILLNERVRLLTALSSLLDESKPRLAVLHTITVHLKTQSCKEELQSFLDRISKGDRWEESVSGLHFLTRDIQFVLQLLPQSAVNPASLLQTTLEYYREKQEGVVRISLQALQPALLILIGLCTAFAIYAMYSPLLMFAPLLP